MRERVAVRGGEGATSRGRAAVRALLRSFAGALFLLGAYALPALVFLTWNRSAVFHGELRLEDMTTDEQGITRFAPNLRRHPFRHPRPHLDATTSHSQIYLSTNAEGFRDVDHPLAPAPGVRRVALVGDSFVFGLNLQQEEMLTPALDAALNPPGGPRTFEVLNFALPGLNSDGMGRVTQVFAAKYRPDVVVYSYICDDISETDVTSLTGWMRRVDELGFLSHATKERLGDFLVRFKELRYTFDYNLYSALPALYEERLLRALDYFFALARKYDHRIILTRYCMKGEVMSAIERFNAAHGHPIRVVTPDFELDDESHHPTAESNRNLAPLLAAEIREALAPPKGIVTPRGR